MSTSCILQGQEKWRVPMSMISNENLLINWDFRNPVNRNGKMEYAGNGIIAIDQWLLETGRLTIKDGQIAVRREIEDVDYAGIIQRLKNVKNLSGKTVTFSVLTAEDGTTQCYSATFPYELIIGGLDAGPLKVYSTSNGLFLRMFLPDFETEVCLIAVKLELGDHQTLARQDAEGNWVLNDAPDYDLQYSLCTQYSPSTGEWIGNQHSNENLLVNGDFRHPVNRNGKDEYTDAGITIDMWRMNQTNGSKLQVVDNGIKYTNVDGLGDSYIRYIISVDKTFKENQFTYSVLFSEGSDTKLASVVCYISDSGEDYEVFWGERVTGAGLSTITFQIPNQTTLVEFRINAGDWEEIGQFTAKAAKLEIGSTQTLAYQDINGNWVLNNPPNYEQQYALCQQYSQNTGEWIGNQISNLNLLDNWYLADPINQREGLEYSNNEWSGLYGIDRWYLSVSKYNVSEHRLTALQNFGRIVQYVESKHLSGKVVTFSVLTSEVTGGNLMLFAGPGDVSQKKSSTPGLLSITFTMPESSDEHYSFQNSVTICLDQADASVVIEAAKLELGRTQTLAHKEGDTWVLNDSSPNKALELAKCQRYFERKKFNYGPIATGFSDGGEEMLATINYSEKRTTPVVSVSNGGAFQYAGNGVFEWISLIPSNTAPTPQYVRLAFNGPTFPHLIPLTLIAADEVFIDIDADR